MVDTDPQSTEKSKNILMNYKDIYNITQQKEISIFEWLTTAHTVSQLSEELAYHCFYMAHLKDPQLIKANSDLQFEVSANEQRQVITTDDVIKEIFVDTD
jgi:hypothetical protein